jgi:hypothetical protein
MGMKKSVFSMLATAVMLLFVVVGTLASAGVLAQETGSGSSTGKEPDSMPPYNPPRECVLTEEQQSDILEMVLEYNTTFKDFGVRNLTYVYCNYDYQNENDTYFYGGLTLMAKAGEIRHKTTYFGGNIINGGMNLTYVSEPWTEYDFTGYFTETEDQKIDYYLKQRIVDVEVYGEADKSVWVRINKWPQYRCLLAEKASDDSATNSIRAPCGSADTEDVNWQEFRASFDALVQSSGAEDSFYYENQWEHMGLIKVPYSKVRGLLGDWFNSVGFFGEKLKFTFSGNATVSTNIDDVISKLKEQGFTVCSPIDSSCPWNEKKMAWYSEENIGIYLYKQFGNNVWFSANAFGKPGQETSLYASLSGPDADSYKQEAADFMKAFANRIGIDLGEINFTENEQYYTVTKSSPDGIVETTEGVAPPSESPEVIYKYLQFKVSITIPYQNYGSVLSDWEKQEGAFYTQYTSGGMGVMIGDPYVSYWERTGEYNYDSVQIGENLIYTSVVMDSPDFEQATAELSRKVSGLAEVTGDWSMEYYPTGEGGWGPIYRLMESSTKGETARTLAGGSGTATDGYDSNALPQVPTFQSSFGPAFDDMRQQVEVSGSVQQMNLAVVVLSVLIVGSMASFIYFMLK